MEIVDLAVAKTTSIILPWGDTLIMPFGDIQYGAEGVDIDMVKRDVEYGLEHDAYFIGMGDYVDVASPSNRAKVRHADFYDSVMSALEDSAERHLEKLKQVFKGTEGRWFGLLEGHHFWEFSDGTTTDTRLAQYLKTTFLGTCGMVRLTMTHPTAKRASITYDIWAHHGIGSGQTQAAPLNRLEKISGSFAADLFLINHYQRKGAVPKDWLYVDKQGKLRHQTKYLVATGGYMRGYTQGSKQGRSARGSYVEKAMFNPASLGGVRIVLKPTSTKSVSLKTEVTV